MGSRRLLVLLVALVVAGGTALYARSWVQSQRPTIAAQPPPAAVQENYREVLVAAQNLPTGSFIRPDSVRWQRWPQGRLPDTYVVREQRDLDAMVGAVVRRGIAQGEPLTDGAVVKPGDRGFLAAVLQPGMRAVSVPINDASGNAGLIFPGDRVDLIVTQTVVDDDRGTRRLASETVLENLRVLAMGRRVDDEPGVLPDARLTTTTLEVTPQQAEIVALVTELGRLALSLRSLAQPDEVAELDDGATPDLDRLTWDHDVSRVRRAETTVMRRVVVVRGNDKSEVSVPGNQP